MDLTVTLILLAVAAAVTALSGWRGARAPDPLRGPRMIPWRFLMILAAAMTMLLLIHLATLLGAQRPAWV